MTRPDRRSVITDHYLMPVSGGGTRLLRDGPARTGRFREPESSTSSGPISLREPMAADRAAAEVREVVITGVVRPGGQVPLTDIAHRHGARQAGLLRRLRRTEYDGLIELRDDAGTATLLDAGELSSMIRLAGLLRVELFERAARLLTPAQLDLELRKPRVSALTPLPGDDGDFTHPSIAAARKQLSDIDQILYGPAARTFELRILNELRLALRRYFLLGLTRDPGMSVIAESTREVGECYLELRHDLLVALRAGRLPAVRELANRHTRYDELIAEQSLVPEHLTSRGAGIAPEPRVACLRAL